MNDTNIIEWLEKLAVDTEVLRDRLSRVPGVFPMSKKDAQGEDGPAWSIGRTAQTKETIAREGGTTWKVKKVLEKRKQGSPLSGRIEIADPKTLAQVMGEPRMTESGAKAWHSATLAHELFERGTHPKDLQPVVTALVGHHNLNVLVQERNLRNRLIGKGAKEAVAADARLRDRLIIPQIRNVVGGRAIQDGNKAISENRLVERTVRHAFGRDEASHFLQPGQTMNRSMRKALDRILAKTNAAAIGHTLLGR